MESKALVKSTNSNVACKFFALTPSRILRMVNICEVVDLFLLVLVFPQDFVDLGYYAVS